MQNKLNEILELFIEKSSKWKGVFYCFKYDTLHEAIIIERYSGREDSYDLTFGLDEEQLNKALEYMQNE